MKLNRHSSDDITVVVRSANERTVESCRTALGQVFPQDHVLTLCERPFNRALSRGLELGIEKNRPWILFVDGDVLVEPSSLSLLIEMREKMPQNVFALQGLVRDRFFPINRPAGNHLYRVSLAEKGLKTMRKNKISIRPESALLKEMARKGHPWYQSSVCIGIHDYEQYFRDIYRKCFLHAHKHKNCLQYVVPYWLRRLEEDKDFLVCAYAVIQGLAHVGSVELDKNFMHSQSQKCLKEMGLMEKSTNVEYDALEIPQIANAPVASELLELQQIMTPANYMDAFSPTVPTVTSASKLPQWLPEAFIRRIGRVLTRIGNRLQK